MIAKTKWFFLCYAIGVLLFFGCIEIYLSARERAHVPSFVEWVEMPGSLLAAFCLVGVHSDYFALAAFLSNVAVYLLVPYLGWKLFGFLKRPRPRTKLGTN